MGRNCRSVSLKDLTYKPRQESAKVILDDNVREELDQARAALTRARREDANPDKGLISDVPRLEKAVEKAETAADKAAVLFTFRALPRHKVAELVADCPPTTTQLDRWKEAQRATPLVPRPAPDYDYEKFAPLLIAASIVEPTTTESEVTEMWEKGAWSDAIWTELWKVAWKVNQEVSTRPT